MGRLEAFALGNKIWPSFLDAIGNAMGYAWILIVVAFFRLFISFELKTVFLQFYVNHV